METPKSGRDFSSVMLPEIDQVSWHKATALTSIRARKNKNPVLIFFRNNLQDTFEY
jgi:hypothetical protein